MVKCLNFRNVEFRKGRPMMAPHVKFNKDLIRDEDEVIDDTREEVCESWKRGLNSYDEEEEENPVHYVCTLELNSIEQFTPASMEVNNENI